MEARRIEFQCFMQMRVNTEVSSSEAHMNGCKVITKKWLDIDKGDAGDPNYRSRLVGREMKLDS